MKAPMMNIFVFKAFTYFWIMSFGCIPRNRITEPKGINIFNAFNSWHIFILKIKVNKDSGKFLILYYVVTVSWSVMSLDLGMAALWHFKRDINVVSLIYVLFFLI